MPEITIGKYRRLQQCATPRGAIAVLALDHRNNLRNALNPSAPETVTDDMLIGFKQDVVRLVTPAATAVLLDPQFGAAQAITAGALPGRLGLLVALEATGYSGDPTARDSRILDGWSVEKLVRMGATAAKLLVYYHPDSGTAGLIENLVRDVAKMCSDAQVPLFVEPLSYSADARKKKLTPDERHRVVIETARRLTPLGMDVLKAEFPLDAGAVTDENAWLDACRELSSASVVPWVLLSASVPYEVFLRQVAVACTAGASGVAVGRAVWQEATGLGDEERRNFLAELARERMVRVTALCEALATPWQSFYTAPQVAPDWYEAY